MVQFLDLDDDCLLEVLDRLTPPQLFKMQRVNRRLYRLAGEKIRTKIKIIELWNDALFNCNCHSLSKDQAFKLGPGFESDLLNVQHKPTRRAFMKLLSKCAGVKSINFGYERYEIQNDLLLNIIRRRPEIECLKLSKSFVREKEWNQVLEKVGSNFVHFSKRIVNLSEIKLLEAVALKCPNIKQVDLFIDRPTSKLMATFKMLLKSCWIKLKCKALDGNTFEDVVDELEIKTLDCSLLGDRIDQLSSLKFRSTDGPACKVFFSNLKSLEFSNWKIPAQIANKENFIGGVTACRFERLETFCFYTGPCLSEADFEMLFRHMRSVKKLIINNVASIGGKINSNLLPGSAIKLLTSLETIYLTVFGLKLVEDTWNPKDFLQHLELYVDEIGSLKKLTVEINYVGYKRWVYKWEKAMLREVKRMKQKQNQVKVDLILEPFFIMDLSEDSQAHRNTLH